MKKIIFTLLIIHFSLIIANAQNTWFWQNPYPQGNWLNGADAVNSNIYYAVGKGATLIKTTDGGGSWNVKNFLNGKSTNFNSIRFADENTGWICGDSGYILKTTNAGITWNKQVTNVQSNLKKLFFLNENSGFAIGYGGVVLKTTNGGTNWNDIGFGNNHYWLNDIFFINNLSGYICGSNVSGTGSTVFYTTTNGGVNWILIPSLARNNCVYFINEQTGFAAGADFWTGYGYFYKTTNAGLDWQGTLLLYDQYINLYFINENTGWANRSSGVWKTTDGSANWIKQYSYTGGTCGQMDFMKFLDSNTFLGVGCSHILKSLNGGNNWIEVSKVANRESHYNIQFINENTGWTDNFGGMLKTIDAGNNWLYTEILGVTSINYFYFIDYNTGWIKCRYNNKTNILKTTNSGVNWNPINLDTLNNLNQIFFLNQNTGFMSFDTVDNPHFLKLFKTTNSGDDWQLLSKVNNFSVACIQFINYSIGFALFQNTNNIYDYNVYKTTNTGVNWFQQGNTLQNFLASSLFFINEYTGWLAGGIYNVISSIYKTTNGGINWQNENLEYMNLVGIGNLYFTNDLTGYAITGSHFNSNGTIISTSNGGQNWIEINPGPTDYINNLFFLNNLTGWLCTDEGGIMKTTNGGLTFTSRTSNEIPKEYYLSQNYPNPFNPSTNIRYEIPKNGFVNLVIYDILGREIQTLVNEKQTAGSYEVTFNGTNLSSGVYFYKLQAGNYTETKRMLLIK